MVPSPTPSLCFSRQALLKRKKELDFNASCRRLEAQLSLINTNNQPKLKSHNKFTLPFTQSTLRKKLLKRFLKELSVPEIRSSDILITRDKPLSVGKTSEVFEGELLFNRKKVAVKKLTAKTITDSVSRAFQHEIRALCKIRHSGIVELLGAFIDEEEEGSLIIVYELCKGDLRWLMKQNKLFRDLTILDKLSMIASTVFALSMLHSEGVVHRDIKPENLLISESMEIKLGDFGVAEFSYSQPTDNPAGTLGYSAPEIISGTSKGSKESDIFSFGVVLLEIFGSVSNNPFITSVDEYERQFEEDKHMNTKLLFEQDVPLELIQIIQRCLKVNPQQRCTAVEVATVIEALLATR